MKHCIVFSFLICFSGLSSCKKGPTYECKEDLVIETNNANLDAVKLWVPRAFSPDKDGLNDVYRFTTKGITGSIVKIKKGLITVYESTDNEWSWDGMHKGKIKYGEFKLTATLTTHLGEEVKVEAEISSINNFDESRSCDCALEDQIDLELGFIRQSNEVCWN